MDPILFYIGNYPIYSYSFFILLALIVATIGVIFQARRQGIKMIDCIYLSMLAFIIGVIFAKLVSIIRFFGEYYRWGASTILFNFITLVQITSIFVIIVSIIVLMRYGNFLNFKIFKS